MAQSPKQNISYPVILGDSFINPEIEPCYHTIMYQFKPNNTIKDEGKLYIKKKTLTRSTVHVEFPNNKGKNNPYFTGKGTYSKSQECALIFDGEKFYLERIGTAITGLKVEPSRSPINFKSILNQSISDVDFSSAISHTKTRNTSSSLSSIVSSKIQQKKHSSVAIKQPKTSAPIKPIAQPIQVHQTPPIQVNNNTTSNNTFNTPNTSNNSLSNTDDMDISDSDSSDWDDVENTLTNAVPISQPIACKPIQLNTNTQSEDSESGESGSEESESESGETESGETDSEDSESGETESGESDSE